MRLPMFIGFFVFIFAASSAVKDDITQMHEQAYKLLKTNPEEAMILALQSEEISRKEGLPYEESNSLFIQAWIYKMNGEPGKSFVLYLKALQAIKEDILIEKSAKLYTNLLIGTGSILKEHYAYSESLSYYDEGISVALKYKWDSKIQILYQARAGVYQEMSALTDALLDVQTSFEYAKKLKDVNAIVSVLNNKGLIEVDLKMYDQALVTYREILELDLPETIRNEYHGKAWHNIGHTYMQTGRATEALEAFLRAAEVKSRYPDDANQFITWTDIAENYLNQGNLKLAREYGEKAVQAYDSMPLSPDNYRLFDLMSNIAFKQGEYKLSRSYVEQYMAENKEFLNLQEDLIRVKDQYKMEILAAGFFLEVNSAKNTDWYTMWLTIVGSVFSLLLLVGIGGQYYVRRSIRASIRKIQEDSFI